MTENSTQLYNDNKESCVFEDQLKNETLIDVNENVKLISNNTGLKFGTDSYLLSAFAKRCPGNCVELGGGTGIVSLLCASRNKYTHIYTVEIQEYYHDLIKRNAELNNLECKITPILGDIRKITLNDINGEADAVITNPPYMKASSGKSNVSSMLSTARRELNGTISDFCKAASSLLKFGGYFYVVYRPERLADLIFSMKSYELEPKKIIFIHSTVSKKPCLVLVEGKKGAASDIVFAPPLIIYSDDNKYTENFQRIYDTFSTDFLFK